jgi:hypothetical protein
VHPFLVKYRVGNKTCEEEMLASSEEEAQAMMENSLEWENPKKNIKIISVKSLHSQMKRLKNKGKRAQDPFEY